MRALFIFCGLLGHLSAEQLRLRDVIRLEGETYHVQGIDVRGSRLFVSSVDRQEKRGLLFEFHLPSGRRVRSIEIHRGALYHPGGLMMEGGSLWIAIAEYRPHSQSVIQRRHLKTLSLEASFPISDHIGAVAVTPDHVIGANWDAHELYVWRRTGQLLRRIPNPTGIAFQDLKFVRGQLIGSGVRNGAAVIAWMRWPSLELVREIHPGRTDRGVAFTQEGMALAKRRLWLLPEDTPSRLFVFDLPSGW